MKKIIDIAATCMDLYNQDFLDDNEGFFDIDFFISQVSDEYSASLDLEYKTAYASLRGDNRHKTEFVTVDPMWLTHEEIEIKKDGNTGYWKAEIKGKIFSFQYDTSSCGLQNIAPAKRGSTIFIRSKQEHEFMDQFMPESKTVLYWPWQGAIRFDNGTCDSAIAMYVSAPHPELEIQDGKAADIQNKVLARMFLAKNGGQPANESNDSSKVVTQPELNKEEIK